MWGFWRPRQPRERPRWGWGRSPTPSPPPKNNPSPGNGGNGGNNNNPPPSGTNPEPVPAGPQPDPSVYNWGLDRSNQQEGSLDKHNGQCPSRGSGVTVFILDTGCRTTHQVRFVCLWCFCMFCVGRVGGRRRRLRSPIDASIRTPY